MYRFQHLTINIWVTVYQKTGISKNHIYVTGKHGGAYS